jgi:hypothetical protein
MRNGAARVRAAAGNSILRAALPQHFLANVLVVLVVCLFAAQAGSAPPASLSPSATPSETPMPSLDEQVQDIKSDVLEIAAELRNLEERLLFPSNTQVAVFVSLDLEDGERLELDSVQIQLDGEPAANHIYSFKELEALRKGGVQRLYTGNVRAGKHRLDVAIAGQTANGEDFARSESFSFTKQVDPKLVGITLGGQGSDGASIRLEDW